MAECNFCYNVLMRILIILTGLKLMNYVSFCL